jgi:hypothetical protein
MYTKITTLCLIVLPLWAFGQKMGFDDIDGTKLQPWITKDKTNYQFAYHFGDSELESNLVILVGPSKCYAQISGGDWSADGKEWIKKVETLSNVRIEGNKFFSDKTNGEFVLYKNGTETTQCLKVYKPWSGVTEKGQYEVGFVAGKIELFFDGKYPQASMRVLTPEELDKLSKAELQLMRNEIYARYGFVFKKGGAMYLHFSKQDWYKAQNADVNKFLTELERENIAKIQQQENK